MTKPRWGGVWGVGCSEEKAPTTIVYRLSATNTVIHTQPPPTPHTLLLTRSCTRSEKAGLNGIFTQKRVSNYLL
ncbi:hypothetical protein [Nostoc sp. FACHB-110]|uniref:hypothetical protein n=1 Tax=Nostoc sp. FACHB-110 TaxID=2692834 RepID=UPI00168551C3|nr:hypothetical protein [Nostoc sp. FACHB-110]MBD2439553.1 hypothetical protein [Nostoc sp. FACHB-110]